MARLVVKFDVPKEDPRDKKLLRRLGESLRSLGKAMRRITKGLRG